MSHLDVKASPAKRMGTVALLETKAQSNSKQLLPGLEAFHSCAYACVNC